MKIKPTSFFLLFGVISVAAAAAAQPLTQRWFVGASVGRASLDHRVVNIPTGSHIGTTNDESTKYLSLEGGFRFSRHLAASLAWHHYGDGFEGKFSDSRGLYTPSGSLAFPVISPYRVKMKAISAAIIPIFPINERIRVFAKLGVLYWGMDFEWLDNDGALTGRKEEITEHDVLYGAGFEYSISARWSARLEYEHANTDLGALKAGVSLSF